MPSQLCVPLPWPCSQQVSKPEVSTLLRAPLTHQTQRILLQPGTVPYVCVTHFVELWQEACKPLHFLMLHCLAGLLLTRHKTLARKKKERQLRDSAALACVVPGDEQSTNTKAVDLDGSQESSESGFKPATQTSWQLWELVTGSAAITEGQHGCMSSRTVCHLPCTSG